MNRARPARIRLPRVATSRTRTQRGRTTPVRTNGPSPAVRWSRPGYALVLALLVVAPLLRPGYLLLRDAVSTPRSYLSDTALGLTSPPRATPQDFAVALASHLVDGGIVVKALLVIGLMAGGMGCGRTGGDRAAVRGCGWPIRRDHAGDLESLCR